VLKRRKMFKKNMSKNLYFLQISYCKKLVKTLLKPDIFTRVSLSLGLEFRSGSKTKTQRDQDSEFNSINFGVEIKKCLKFLRPILDIKNLSKFF